MSYRLRKRDGSVVYAMHLRDGSWFEMPSPDDQPLTETASPTKQPSPVGSVRQFLREIGRRGGQARARRHSREELAAWGRVRHETEAGV